MSESGKSVKEPLKSEDTPQRDNVENYGMPYQYSAVTYLAINLSKKSAEEKYVLFCNPKGMGCIDDLVLKINRSGKYHLYFFQMKHKEPGKKKKKQKKKNKASKTEKEGRINDENMNEFDKYKKDFVTIKKTAGKANENFIFKDVDKENMHFFFYSNRSSKDVSPIKIDGIDYNIVKDSDIEHHENYAATLPKELFEECYKLVPPREAALDEDTSTFLEKTRLFLNQPNYNVIGDSIIKLYNNELSDSDGNELSLEKVKKLVDNVHGYFKINKTSIMTREAFEIELLRILLSDNIDKKPHEKLTEMNIEQVQKWNQVTSSYVIVVVEDVNRIKAILFGCILQKIRDLLKFDAKQQSISTKDIISKFMVRSKNDGKILWINITDSFDVILIELWRHYNIPLILKLNKDTDIAILKKYRHLKKNFIVRCDVEKHNAVMEDLKEVFTSVADIKDTNKRNEFLKSIQVSLQGRTPVSLESIIGTDEPCMKKLGSAEILRFIKKKSDIYLDEKSFETIKNMVIIKEISEEERQEHLEVKHSVSKNLVINCHSSNVESKKKEIKDNAEYNKYSVYHLKQCGKKWKFVSGIKSNVKDFLVDEDGNHVFTSDTSHENVTVIGTYLETHQHPYSVRKLHLPIIKSSIFDSKPRVYFIFGNLNSLDSEIKKKIEDKIKMSGRSEEFLQNPKLVERDLVYSFENSSKIRDIVNNGDALKTCPVVLINVSTGKLVLLYYKNCDDLDSYISYAEVLESVFSDSNSEKYFKYNPITVISGDAGMGKTALLHSLSQAYDEKCIVLLCNLTDYRKRFQEERKPIREIEFDLNFIESRFNKLFRAIYNYQVESGKVILLLDSFDEMWPTANKKLLDFIKVVARKNISMIIASRTIFANKIIDDIQVYPIKLANLSPSELQNCYGITFDIENIPTEFLENPLYFTFIINLHKNGSHVSNIGLITLYQKVIAKMIDRYQYTTRDEEEEDVLEMHQRMALVIIFDENLLEQQSIFIDYKSIVRRLQSQKIKLGIIKEFKQGYPVFMHHTFAEFLTAQWLSENLFNKDFTNAPSIYRKMVDSCDKNVRYFFDSIVCNDLLLHKAIINGNLASVKDLLSEDNNIEKVDECGRNPSHLAACYCFKKENYEILELIVRHMIVNRKCALHCRDTFLSWTWLDYLKNENPDYFSKARQFRSIAALKKHYLSTFNWHGLCTLSLLYKIRTYFDIFAIQEIIDCGCLDIACELIEFYSEDDESLGIFFKLCEHICDIIEFKYINARIRWSEYRKHEFTLLHVASLYGHSQTVENLIKSRTDVNVTDNNGATPMHYAIIGDSSEVVSILLAQDDINMDFIIKRYTYLHFAAKYSNLKIFKLLFEKQIKNKNVAVNERNADGDSLFTFVVKLGKLDIVKFLLSNGADVTRTLDDGDNALHLACIKMHDNIIWYLATKYPDMITIKNRRGKLPFDYASDKAKAVLTEIEMTQRSVDSAEVQLHSLNEAQIDDEEISTYMVDETILPSAPTNSYEQLIEFPLNDLNKFLSGVKTSDIELLQNLVNGGLNVEDIKEPILHAAIEIGNMEIIEFLLVHKIKINIVDKFNRSAMHIAARKGITKIAELLLENNINLKIVNKFNESALHIALKYGNLEIVELLINEEIVNVVTKSGESALHYAVRMNNKHIVNLLLQKGAKVIIKSDKNEETDIRIKYKFNQSAVRLAFIYEMWDIMKLFVKKNITEFSFCDKRDALRMGIDNKDVNIIKRILENLTDNDLLAGQFLDEEMLCSIYEVLPIEDIENLFTAPIKIATNQFFLDIALQACISMANLEILKFLIGLNLINWNFMDEGGSHLHYALRRNFGEVFRDEDIKCLKYLIPKCKDVIDAVDEYGDTALHIAVEANLKEVVECLIKEGIDINIEDFVYDKTALEIAREIGNREIINLLENAIERESSSDNGSEINDDHEMDSSSSN